MDLSSGTFKGGSLNVRARCGPGWKLSRSASSGVNVAQECFSSWIASFINPSPAGSFDSVPVILEPRHSAIGLACTGSGIIQLRNVV